MVMDSRNVLILAAGVGIGYLIFKEMNRQEETKKTKLVPQTMPQTTEPTPIQVPNCPSGKKMLDLGNGNTECVPIDDFVYNIDTGQPEVESFVFNTDYTYTYKTNFPPFETRVINFQQGDMVDGYVFSKFTSQNGKAVQNFEAVTRIDGQLPNIESVGEQWLSIPLNVLTIA